MKDNDRQQSIRIKMFRLSVYTRHRLKDKNTGTGNNLSIHMTLVGFFTIADHSQVYYMDDIISKISPQSSIKKKVYTRDLKYQKPY